LRFINYRTTAVVVLNTLILLAALDAMAWALLRIRHPPGRPNAASPERFLPDHFMPTLRAAYGKDDETIRRILHETYSRPIAHEPFTEFLEPVSHGEFVNVEAPGFRRSWRQRPWPPAPDTAVFVFGGSTTFGYGVTDEETLVSHLARELSARGRADLAVYNFGRASYYSAQELILFERLLLAGHRPRLVLFVDGLNGFARLDDDTAYTDQLTDAFDAHPPTVFDAISATSLGQVAAGIRTRLFPPATPPVERPPDAAALARVTDRYLRTVAIAQSIAAAHGISSVFVAQPVPGYKNDLTKHPFYRGIEDDFGYAGLGYRTSFAAAFQTRNDPRLVWCADVIEGFVARKSPAWVDEVHYTDGLNAAVAACAANAIFARGLLDR